MKNTITIKLAAISLTLGLILSLPLRGHTAENDVMSIMKQTKKIFEPARSSKRKIVISGTAYGEKTEHPYMTAGQVIEEFPDGKRMLMVILEPEIAKGTAFLIWERKNKPTTMMIYLPFMKRVRELKPIEQYSSFLSTDFTYADLGFIKLHEGYKLLGAEKHAGVSAYKVEEKMLQGPIFYSKIITWIDTDSLLPLQRDYYNNDGELWKTELFEDVSVIDGVPTPLKVRMKDIIEATSTELTISEVDYDADIPDELFYPKELSRVGAHPIWQAFRSESVKKK